MKSLTGGLLLALLISFPGSSVAETGPSQDPSGARFVTEDLERFWDAWDAAKEARDDGERAGAFFEHYYQPGSPGLKDFIRSRIYSVYHLLDAIDGAPRYYASLRPLTRHAAQAAEPAREAFERLEALYPDAVFPDVYIVMGRLNSGGTTGAAGLLIGFEMYGRQVDTPLYELNEWLKTVLRPVDDLPYIIAHELVHYQQPQSGSTLTLLEQVYREGSADFVGELISGRHINHHVHQWALPREAEIWRRFAGLMDQTDTHGFLYGGERPEGWPQDVGYFVGYRIAQAYYEQAEDKRGALAEILTTTDVPALLEKSGYARRFDN